MALFDVLLENSDILFSIMLHSHIHDVNALSRINKTTCLPKTPHFWMNKFGRDYPEAISKSQDWESEYKSINLESTRASHFIEVLTLFETYAFTNPESYVSQHYEETEDGGVILVEYRPDVTDEYTDTNDIWGSTRLYLSFDNRDVDINELTMLPQSLKDFADGVKSPGIHFAVDKICGEWRYQIKLEGIKPKSRERSLVAIHTTNICNYTLFFTLLLYTYPDIIIWDENETPFLYNPREEEPSEPTPEWERIFKYWKKVMK
jgi:hypothetical protein